MAAIASRLERATQPALRLARSSSSFVTYHSTNNDADDGPPSPGTYDAVGCSQCGVELLRGSCSLLCLACGAFHNHSPVPTMRSFFFSSLAYRRLLEALEIDDLEPNLQAVGVESSTPVVLDGTARTALWSFCPLTAGVKSTSNLVKTDQLSRSPGSNLSEPTAALENIEQPLSKLHSLDLGRSTGIFMSSQESCVHLSDLPDPETSHDIAAYVEDRGPLDVKERSEVKNNILDFSSQLTELSLEDFFLNQYMSQDSTLVNPVLASRKSSEIPKESFFWDPLIETVSTNREGLTVNKVSVFDGLWSSTNGEEQQGTSKDDPFLSWECEFQSAVPAIERSGAGSLIGFEMIAEASHAGNSESFGDPFAGHCFLGTDSGNNIGSVSTSRGEEILTSSRLLVDKCFQTQEGDQHSGTNLDGFVSEHKWLQSTATPATDSSKIMIEQELFLINQRVEVHTKMPVEEHQQKSLEEDKSELVSSLLAQLHDLSFMLADKLVINSRPSR